MTRSPAELKVPEGEAPDTLKARLDAHYRCKQEHTRQVVRTYLDSFDWRVDRASGRLAHTQEEGRGSELLWADRATGEILHRLAVASPPRFFQELPPSPLRDRLASVLQMRALLPVIRLESRFTLLRVLDDEEKTLVRLELEEAHFSSPDASQGGSLPGRLRLMPVKGYEQDYQRVAALLESVYEAAGPSPMDAALQAIGRSPGDYSSSLDYDLRPDTRADLATKEIHLGLLKTLESNIEGTQANLDSEFLHDLRVATRRIRSALSQIPGVFPAEVTERFKTGYAWVQEITGPVRDMDVYLLALDDYRADLPDFLQDALDPLRAFLETHYAAEQRALAKELDSPQLDKLLKDYRAFLEAPVPEQPLAANAPRPIKELADERIWKMYRRVIAEGRAIQDQSPAEELHELRKSCKKLRYLLEFFASLYPEKRINALVKIMKSLLDNLGAFQDLAVQAHTLQHYAAQMVTEREVKADTLLAMGALIGGLIQRQQEARARFAEVFEGFDTPEHQVLFKSLFRGAPA